MRKYFLILTLSLLITQSFGQNNKALLWEISKPGMAKKSYIYGTMHVSGKIAYHLGIEFFKALKEVDAIALESNPIIWLDEIFESENAYEYLGKYSFTNQVYQGFYKSAFKLTVPDNKSFGRELSYNHFLTNWMLYRENVGKSDFEEETFLDMFIYQAGRKNNKPVYSLEDFNESRFLSNMSRLPDMDEKQTSSWFKELKKEKGVGELIQDAYRNQDIELLDSLHRESSSENYMKYLLYERNYIMADNIDSILNTGINLFIGIGAAHLPNTLGVLNLLREKGYTVNPIVPTITQEAKDAKEALSLKKADIPLINELKTELFSVKVPNKIYETPSGTYSRQFFAPELTNGTFYTIDEISHYSFFGTYNKADYLVKIDSLLFEYVPGKILSKKEITKSDFKGLDVMNKTKSGDHQRYQIFTTPTKILIFKMGGKDEYVKNNSDSFFNSIELTPVKNEWKTITNLKEDFTVDVPAYVDIKGNTQVTGNYQHPELEAYDPATKTYYFLRRASLFDFIYIEEDEFELMRIMDKFADQFDADSVYNKKVSDMGGLPVGTSETILPNGSILNMKVVIKNAYYYLLATVAEKSNEQDKFFSSFKLGEFKYTYPFVTKTDSILKFTVQSNYLAPDDFKNIKERYNEKKKNKDVKEDKSFLAVNKFDVYYSENYERVTVSYNKYHRFSHYDNADTLWSRLIKSFSYSKSIFVSDKKVYSNGDTNYCEVTYGDTGSFRTIYKKFIQFNDVVYTLSANTDTVSTQSEFVSTFFKTFKPIDVENTGKSLFEDKTPIFFESLKGDSLQRDIAYQSILTHVGFEDEDAGELMEVIKNHPFPAEHTPAKAQMISDLGYLKDERILPFLTNLYVGMEDTALYQLSILRALANQKTKKSFETIIQLLETDIPVGMDENEIDYLMGDLYDTLALTKYIFPQLLDYTFVDEYSYPVYNLLYWSLDSGAVSPKQLKKHYPQILRESKLLLKSQFSYEQSQIASSNKNNYYFYGGGSDNYLNEGNDKLIMYSTLLIPFYKDKNVRAYFDKLSLVKDFVIKTDMACAFIEHNMEVPESVWKHLASDKINYAYLVESLKRMDRLDLFPAEDLSQIRMTESQLYQKNFDFDKDTNAFIKKVFVDAGKEKGYVYFFKSQEENKEKWELDYVGFQPEDTTELSYSDAIYRRGISIAKGEDIDKLISDEIKSIEILYRKRASEKTGGNFWW